jgi:HK97 family phage major capsid protein
VSATDAMVARLQTEIEERATFQNQLIETAEREGRDLHAQEMELYQNAAGRIGELSAQLGPLQEGVRIAVESAARSRELHASLTAARDGRAPVGVIEYRTAGEYIVDRWQAAVGVEDARQRVEMYERAAAHQTTADNAGIIPKPIVGSVINFIDSARPIVSALGPLPVASGQFTRPRVTQHTQVGAQTTEKTELASRKMLISGTPVSLATYGGYVNVSRQNIDWSVPSIMDLVVNDLAAEYAIDTETVTAAALSAAATAGTPQIPATGATQADVIAAVWGAAGAAYTATRGAGRLILAVSPDLLGLIGPMFPPVGPTNAQSSGFEAGAFGSGPVGNIAGISVVMSPGLGTRQGLMINTAAAEVYEQRIGTLSVTEPSVLGVQVAYAGYFAAVVLEPLGVIDITA